ncbi:TIGR02281 family clan AA aspartic protease [Hydrogenophaga sp.]|uniref:retropepsin-like aspartic protease family protein n=1 Tax=Hydrogenophaga sp. TaxID=1904254 RepID=UPI002608095C|nr:TIGR02281 family clan AA aspartic protease [Hydrogenophaga sp.]MCW5654399.1 TIGR02281 family clan AA aspartic protease [Hydrogenophaga sp.]
MRISPAVALLGLAGLALPALAQQVTLSGLSNGRALLVIDGGAPRFLTPGQLHQGVRLLSAQGEVAVIEVNGQRQTLRVGDAPVSVGRGKTDAEAGPQRIVMTADAQGHFMPPGQINGREVQFMVDTGATLVILSESDARRINLAFDKGRKVKVSTANGAVAGYEVRLASIKVGEAMVYDVPGLVLPQAMPFVLLGNSFLTRFQMQRNNDQLTLERRY